MSLRCKLKNLPSVLTKYYFIYYYAINLLFSLSLCFTKGVSNREKPFARDLNLAGGDIHTASFLDSIIDREYLYFVFLSSKIVYISIRVSMRIFILIFFFQFIHSNKVINRLRQDLIGCHKA